MKRRKTKITYITKHIQKPLKRIANHSNVSTTRSPGHNAGGKQRRSLKDGERRAPGLGNSGLEAQSCRQSYGPQPTEESISGLELGTTNLATGGSPKKFMLPQPVQPRNTGQGNPPGAPWLQMAQPRQSFSSPSAWGSPDPPSDTWQLGKTNRGDSTSAGSRRPLCPHRSQNPLLHWATRWHQQGESCHNQGSPREVPSLPQRQGNLTTNV